MKALRTLTVTKKKQVATITMHFGRALKQELKSASRRKSSLAWEQPDLAAAFMALREDDSVRVIVLTGSEGQFKVARLGIINYAVPPQDLDRKVNDIVERLLARGAYALAMAKRVANRRVVEHLNMTLDAGVGYEMVSFLQFEKARGKEKKTLD